MGATCSGGTAAADGDSPARGGETELGSVCVPAVAGGVPPGRAVGAASTSCTPLVAAGAIARGSGNPTVGAGSIGGAAAGCCGKTCATSTGCPCGPPACTLSCNCVPAGTGSESFTLSSWSARESCVSPLGLVPSTLASSTCPTFSPSASRPARATLSAAASASSASGAGTWGPRPGIDIGLAAFHLRAGTAGSGGIIADSR